jgi:hypothetical protein
MGTIGAALGGKVIGNALGFSKKAKKATKEQGKIQDEQLGQEQLQLAEEDDELARRKALGTRIKAGRQSLIKTSETGLKKTLG